MVLAILEPVFAGIMLFLINKYILNGSWNVWLQQSCSAEEEVREDENETDEVAQYSSTHTTISDADVHVHCH